MARSVIFVNNSGTDWDLPGLGGRIVPAAGTLDVTNEITDDELIAALQNPLAGIVFAADRFLRVNGVDWTQAQSENYGNQADPTATPAANHALGGTQHETDTLANLNAKISDDDVQGTSQKGAANGYASLGAAAEVPNIELPGHPDFHEAGGKGEISISGLAGVAGDPQVPQAHAPNHEGGSDPISPAGIGAESAFSKNTAFNKNFGSGAGTVCEGDDARLSDARDPTAHPLASGAGPHTGDLPWSELNKTGSSLADLATRAHANLTGVGADDHHNRQHALDSGSDHTGAITDAQHGSRGGSALHSAATPSVNGFMSSADKTKLDAFGTPQQASATSNATTSSGGDVLMAGMTLTPGAGNYIVNFSTSLNINASNQTGFISVYVNGVQVTHTERRYASPGFVGAQLIIPISVCAYITGVGAGQAVEIRWRSTGGATLTVPQRTLVLQKVM
jgi:hypothetical protein